MTFAGSWFVRVAVCMLVLLIQNAAIAQPPIQVTDSFIEHEILDQLRIYTDKTDRETIQTIRTKKRFFGPFSKRYPTGSAPHWCYFVVKNESHQAKKLILKYEQIFADSLSVYVAVGDSAYLVDSPQSWKIPTPNRPYPHIRYPIFSLTIPATTSREVWVKLRKLDGTVLKLPFTLWDEAAFYTYYNLENLFRGFFYGWLFLVSLFAAVLFIFLREQIYLYYSLYVLFLILILAATGGTINQMGWFLPTYMAGPVGNSFFNMAYILFNLRFTTLYIGTNYLPHWLLQSTRFYGALCITLFFSLILIPDFYYWPFVFATFSYLSIVYAAVVVSMLLYGVFRRSVGARFYLGAVLPLFISSICYWLASLGAIDFGEWIITSFKVSVLIEIFILSIGLAYQYVVERRDKRRLQVELINTQKQVIRTQEYERQRIGADLHDDLGATLSAIKGQLETVANLHEIVVGPIQLMEKAIRDLRHISHNLMPPEFAKLGLREVIQETVDRIAIGSDIQFLFISYGQERRFDSDTELTIYRIVVELVNNAVKHAKAQQITTQLIFFPHHVAVLVEDNGRGYVVSDSEKSVGIGLRNIRSRVDYLQSKLMIDSGSGGTTVTLEVPI